MSGQKVPKCPWDGGFGNFLAMKVDCPTPQQWFSKGPFVNIETNPGELLWCNSWSLADSVVRSWIICCNDIFSAILVAK